MAQKLSLKLDLTSIRPILERVTTPVKTRHALIMFVLLMGVVIYTVYTVSDIIKINDDPTYRSEAEAKSLTTRFDQQTIQKVNNLTESDSNAPINLPGGRRNPFVD